MAKKGKIQGISLSKNSPYTDFPINIKTAVPYSKYFVAEKGHLPIPLHFAPIENLCIYNNVNL